MPMFDFDFKTHITVIATYLPVAGLILTFLLANTIFKKWKWFIIGLAPVCIFIVMCLIWGFWTSKIILRRITDPFYISTLLFFLYLVGHYTYLLKRLVISLFHRMNNKKAAKDSVTSSQNNGQNSSDHSSG